MFKHGTDTLDVLITTARHQMANLKRLLIYMKLQNKYSEMVQGNLLFHLRAMTALVSSGLRLGW